MEHEVTITEAAARLGLSRQRVDQFIRAGRLGARRTPLGWFIDRDDLERFARLDRPIGRPKERV